MDPCEHRRVQSTWNCTIHLRMKPSRHHRHGQPQRLPESVGKLFNVVPHRINVGPGIHFLNRPHDCLDEQGRPASRRGTIEQLWNLANPAFIIWADEHLTMSDAAIIHIMPELLDKLSLRSKTDDGKHMILPLAGLVFIKGSALWQARKTYVNLSSLKVDAPNDALRDLYVEIPRTLPENCVNVTAYFKMIIQQYFRALDAIYFGRNPMSYMAQRNIYSEIHLKERHWLVSGASII